jgi:tetratricopeptide (TPR) repeat protein
VVSAVLAAGLALLGTPAGAASPTDYEGELEAIGRELAGSGGAVRAAVLLYRRATLTGDFAEFRAAEGAIGRALAQARAASEEADLLLVRARLAFTLHRQASARRDLERVAMLAGERSSSEVAALRADLDLQDGRCAEARRGYEEVLRADRRWDHLARLAYLLSKTGAPGRAEKLYAEAQAELTAKEMRPYAWLELQRGVLDLERGRAAEALVHFRRADRAYSGHWLIEEHLAEALALGGAVEEAIDRYRSVVARAPHPDLLSALAALLEPRDPEAARSLYERAEAGFAAQLALYREATLAHLVEHRLRRRSHDPALLDLARENHALRPNAEARLLLARVHLALGELAAAAPLLGAVRASSWRTSELARLERDFRVAQRRGTKAVAE